MGDFWFHEEGKGAGCAEFKGSGERDWLLKAVEKWESGAKRPSGMALKLLDIVEKHGLKMLA